MNNLNPEQMKLTIEHAIRKSLEVQHYAKTQRFSVTDLVTDITAALMTRDYKANDELLPATYSWTNLSNKSFAQVLDVAANNHCYEELHQKLCEEAARRLRRGR